MKELEQNGRMQQNGNWEIQMQGRVESESNNKWRGRTTHWLKKLYTSCNTARKGRGKLGWNRKGTNQVTTINRKGVRERYGRAEMGHKKLEKGNAWEWDLFQKKNTNLGLRYMNRNLTILWELFSKECQSKYYVLHTFIFVELCLDSPNCYSCPEMFWSTKENNGCVQMPIEFLDFSDPLSVILLATTAVGLVFTMLIGVMMCLLHEMRFGIGLLLLALTSCFVCTFTFVGEPTNATCPIRQTLASTSLVFVISCVISRNYEMLLQTRGKFSQCCLKWGNYWWFDSQLICIPLLFLQNGCGE